MKKFGFFVILIILLIFTSACSNSSTDSAEMKNEGITINQSLEYGDGLFKVTLEDADFQDSEMTMNVEVVNNSDKDEVVSNVMNLSVTQNGTDLNSDSSPNYQQNQNSLNYTINPGATGELTLVYTLEDTTNPVNVVVSPGDGSGFNIPSESILNVSINPADGTVNTEEAKVEDD